MRRLSLPRLAFDPRVEVQSSIMLGTLLSAVGFSTALTASGAGAPVVSEIEIRIEDVFEENGTTPDHWPYRLGNQLHIETKEEVIRRELLFREGEPLDPEALAETERNLRALPFIREARIETFPGDEEGRTGVRVVVSDSWSTKPEGRLAKVGDEWLWAIGITEENLFGRGKLLSAVHDVNLDREETFVFYRDPRLLGSRVALAAFGSSASDGHNVSLGATRPFYSLETLWSFQARAEDYDRLDPLYQDGERVDRLRHLRTAAELSAARAVHRSTTSALRLHLVYQFTDDLVDTDMRQFGILQFGVSSVTHAFRKYTHLNRFERTEDVNLGNEAWAFAGVSTPTLGGEPGTSYFWNLSERRGIPLNDLGFLHGLASWNARHRDGELQNSLARFRLNWVQKLSLRRVFLAKADFLYGTNLDPEVQFRLGAESGLRGYPVRQFNGNRSLLFSAEARWFLVDDVLRLVSIGVAAYVESGFAWPEPSPIALHDLHSDVGVSLLLGANRVSASRPGVRVDLAYALNPVEGRGRWLLSAGSSLGF
jgi:hemolysin activation/secretion protein